MRSIFALIAIACTLSDCTGARDNNAGSNKAPATPASSGLTKKKGPEAEVSSLSSMKSPGVQGVSPEPGRSPSTPASQKPTDNLGDADKSDKPIPNRSPNTQHTDYEKPFFVSYPYTKIRTKITKGITALYLYDMLCSSSQRSSLTITKGKGDTCGGEIMRADYGFGYYVIRPRKSEISGECILQVICSNGQAEEVQTVALNTIKKTDQIQISNLPTTRKSPSIRTDTFRVVATRTSKEVNPDDISWGIAPNGCPFAPTVEARTGEISWVCWAKGECSFDVILWDQGIPVDRKPITIKCGEAPAHVASRLSRCEQMVTVNDAYGASPFTCPSGTLLTKDHHGDGRDKDCLTPRAKRCGPRIYMESPDNPPFSSYAISDKYDTLEYVTVRQYKNNKPHGFTSNWFQGIPARTWYRNGTIDGVRIWNHVNTRCAVSSYHKSFQGTFRRGRLFGKCTEWLNNGRKASEGTISDGRPEGLWTWWNEAGNIIHQMNFGNNKRPIKPDKKATILMEFTVCLLIQADPNH
jgi:hypothetical protein